MFLGDNKLISDNVNQNTIYRVDSEVKEYGYYDWKHENIHELNNGNSFSDMDWEKQDANYRNG